MTAILILAFVFMVMLFVGKFDSRDHSSLLRKSPIGTNAQDAGRKKMFYVSKRKINRSK
jgi:hypothetical protein